MTAVGSDDDLIAELCSRVADVRGDVRELIEREVRRVAPLATPDEQHVLATRAVARLRGLGELEPLLADEHVDEVLVNGDEIWADRNGELERAGSLASQPVEHLIERIIAPLGRRVDRTSPIVDARLPDGSRVCAVVAPVAVAGPHLSIRRFARDARPLGDFTAGDGPALCAAIVDARCNVLVSGATSSGKTSLLAALLAQTTPGERLVVIEDTSELPIVASHAVRLEARPATPDGPVPITPADLVRAALRLRPDRLVVGEVRGDEVLGMVQALNTGHDGSFSTCHANGPLDALHRLESLVLQAAPTWPLPAIRSQLTRSIDVVVHVARDGDGRRRIESVDEVERRHGPPSAGPPELRRLAARDDDGLEQLAELTVGRR
ncbi:MAG: CpaF family protein [Ilumatobacteraceae bacterium]